VIHRCLQGDVLSSAIRGRRGSKTAHRLRGNARDRRPGGVALTGAVKQTLPFLYGLILARPLGTGLSPEGKEKGLTGRKH